MWWIIPSISEKWWFLFASAVLIQLYCWLNDVAPSCVWEKCFPLLWLSLNIKSRTKLHVCYMGYLLNLWIYFLQSCTSPYSRLEFLSYWETGWRVLLNCWVVLCSASILEPFSWLGFKKTLACPWLAEPETLILCTRSPKFYHKWHPFLNKIFDFCALSLIKLLESPTPHISASWIPIPCQGVVSKDIRIQYTRNPLNWIN